MFAGLVSFTHDFVTILLTDNSSDDMDKKLLLSIQSECNAQGVNIPWNSIATIVGPTITGSAVIQHLVRICSPGIRPQMAELDTYSNPSSRAEPAERCSRDTEPSVTPQA